MKCFQTMLLMLILQHMTKMFLLRLLQFTIVIEGCELLVHKMFCVRSIRDKIL